jgi:hypothetical protein
MQSLASVAGGVSVQDILERVRAALVSRGARGIVGLSRKFRMIDDGGGMSLSEVSQALKECGIALPLADARRVFQYLDRDGSGEVSSDDLLFAIRVRRRVPQALSLCVVRGE